jgi:A/G-specific adenine glycosylase
VAAEITEALLRHYEANRRDLPWRDRGDAYAVWVSEVMLQQTRVDTARPYFERWLRRFPTLNHLADASVNDVLRAWQGLGYYARARNLHRAARMVRERHGGQLPADVDQLRSLPGVGEYTAGAVASIAFGAAVPAVDGNVRRVLARLHDLEAPTAGELRALAARLIPEDRPGDLNQALMELGATVCLPRSPRCEACPVATWCRAREAGVQEARPRPKKRAPVPEFRVSTRVLVQADGRALLVRRPEAGMLGGLWEFPAEPLPPWIQALLAKADSGVELEPVRHEFSHRVETYHPTVHRVAHPGRVAEGAWVPLDDLASVALPAAQTRIAGSAIRALGSGAVGKAPTRDSG